jgi:lysyl-tRNA synthetase class 1
MLRLYDRHDEAAEAYFDRSKLENVSLDDLKRAYHFSQVDPMKVPDRFFPRFSRVAFLLQIPSLIFEDEIRKLKGTELTEEDVKEATQRKEYAQIWLKKYADENSLFTVQDELPAKAQDLTPDQKDFLHKIADLLESKEWQGEELHGAIHEIRKASPLEAKTAFQAIYITLLGKESGPQAGWFLDALDKKFVVARFRQV